MLNNAVTARISRDFKLIILKEDHVRLLRTF